MTGELFNPAEGNEKLSYEAAVKELEGIIHKIEAEDIDVDTLAEKVKRAQFLSTFCRERLRSTEEEVKGILKKMEGDA